MKQVSAKVTLFTQSMASLYPIGGISNAIATSKEVGGAGRRKVEVGILRDGKNMVFTVYPELVSSERMRYIGIEPETKTSAPIVIHLEPDMPAIESGLEPMDRLIKLDGEVIISEPSSTPTLVSMVTAVSTSL